MNVIIYHFPCMDGFTAAYYAQKSIVEPEMIPANYGDEIPGVAGKNVYIVDFSYPYETILKMAETANTILVLDHHDTAREDLEGRDFPDNVEVVFDMERSGAGITFDYFNPDATVRPQLVRVVEDRDLWRFAIEGSREANAYLFAHDYDFEMWRELERRLEDSYGSIVLHGQAILMKQDKDTREFCAKATQRLTIAEHDNIPTVNLPYFMGSEACHHLLQEHPEALFAAYYWDSDEDCREWGLRSRKGEIHVGDVAKAYGGGGHPSAAGFRTVSSQMGDFGPTVD